MPRVAERPVNGKPDRSHHREHRKREQAATQLQQVRPKPGSHQGDDGTGEQGRGQAQWDQDKAQLAQRPPDNSELARDAFDRANLRQGHQNKTVDAAHQHGAEEGRKGLGDQITVLGDTRAKVSRRQHARNKRENHQESPRERDCHRRKKGARWRATRLSSTGASAVRSRLAPRDQFFNGRGFALGSCHRGIG